MLRKCWQIFQSYSQHSRRLVCCIIRHNVFATLMKISPKSQKSFTTLKNNLMLHLVKSWIPCVRVKSKHAFIFILYIWLACSSVMTFHLTSAQPRLTNFKLLQLFSANIITLAVIDQSCIEMNAHVARAHGTTWTNLQLIHEAPIKRVVIWAQIPPL